jgi:superfamily II RNA helicase
VKQEVNLLSEVESRKLQESLQEFQQLYPNSTREIGVKPLLHGVAAHHAGCLPIWKTFIEELFQKGLLKVVFSTETLAAGINMPARYE